MRKRKGTSRRVASEAGQLLKRSRSRKVRSVAGAALAERKLRTRRTSRRSKSHGLVSHPAGSRTASSANPYSSGALSSRRGDIRRNILAAEAHSEQRANHQIDADRSIRGLDLRHSRLARTEQLPELLLSHAAPAPLLPDRVRQPNFELTMAASSSVRPRNSLVPPTFHPADSSRFLVRLSIVTISSRSSRRNPDAGVDIA